MCWCVSVLERDAEHSYGEVNQEDKRSLAFGVLTLCARASLQWRSEQCPLYFSPSASSPTLKGPLASKGKALEGSLTAKLVIWF